MSVPRFWIHFAMWVIGIPAAFGVFALLIAFVDAVPAIAALLLVGGMAFAGAKLTSGE